jgi:DNA-binding transcriptional ArsR family regulator
MTTGSLPEPAPVPAPKPRPQPRPQDYPPSVREIEKKWKGLKPVERKLLTSIRNHTSRSGWGVRQVSKKELADEIGSSVPTVERHLELLEEKHLLIRKTEGKIEKQASATGSPGPKGKNSYRVVRQIYKEETYTETYTDKKGREKVRKKVRVIQPGLVFKKGKPIYVGKTNGKSTYLSSPDDENPESHISPTKE